MRRQPNVQYSLDAGNINSLPYNEIKAMIRAAEDDRYLPLLEEWTKTEVEKIRERISSVEKTLNSNDSGPVIV